MPEPGKPVAEIRDASVKRETAFNPAAMSDMCFYCSKKFTESSPRRVIQTKLGTMLLMHLGCADAYERDGMPKPPEQPPPYTPRNLNFMSFRELQTYIATRGLIPATSRVTMGPGTTGEYTLLQEGKQEADG